MIEVLSFLSNENCFAGHGLSTTSVRQRFLTSCLWIRFK